MKRIAILAITFCLPAAYAASNDALLQQIDYRKPIGTLDQMEITAGLYHKVLLKREKKFDSEIYLTELNKVRPASIAELKKMKSFKGGDGNDYVVDLMKDAMGDRFPVVARHSPYGSFSPIRDFQITEIASSDPIQDTGPVAEQAYVEKNSWSLRLNKAEAAKDLEKAKGASLGYQKDNAGDTETWIAKGALVYQHGKTSNPQYEGARSKLDNSSWMTSFLFDRVDVGGSEKGEVNSLSLEVDRTSFYIYDFDGETTSAFQKIFSLRGLYTSYGLGYNTDFDFDHHLAKAQIEIAPTIPGLLINDSNLSRTFPLLVGAQIDLNFHLEGGVVESDGDSQELLEENFARLGGSIGFTLWPKLPDFIANGNDDYAVSVSANYLHYATIASDMESPNIFEITFNWRLFKTDEFLANMSLGYRYGDVVDTLEDVDLITLGLSFAY